MSSYPCPTPRPGPPPRATATAVHIKRVSVLNGRVVSAYAKRPLAGANPEDLRPESTQELVQLEYTEVDVVVDRRIGRAHCPEANAAPGMSKQTLGSVYIHLQQTLRRRLERAS